MTHLTALIDKINTDAAHLQPVRSIKQIESVEGRLYALCDDGTLWQSWKGYWLKCVAIPGE